jgi:DnaJ-domain-containing protein 1
VEHSYPVSCDAHPAAQRISSAHTAPHASPQGSPWGGAQTAAAYPNLFAQMEELLGAQSEPDSQFFVESWTLGVEAATHRLQERREAAAHRDVDTPTFRPFDFSAPLNFVHDASHDQHAFSSMSSGFSAAWKNAYGVRGASFSHNSDRVHDETKVDARASGQSLTIEDACRMLGVAADSTRKQIKAAYRQLVWRYHPDRLVQGSEQDRRIATDKMTSINEAYHLLCGAGLAAAS